MNNPLAVFHRIRRAHNLTRDEVDALPWPHPRPASDPRLVYTHLALVWTSVAQAIVGPASNTVFGKEFGWGATIAFAVLMLILTGLYLAAAKCKSQYDSFGYEAASCVGFALSLTMYGYFLVVSTANWVVTYNWSFTVALALGNAVRAYVLIRRLW